MTSAAESLDAWAARWGEVSDVGKLVFVGMSGGVDSSVSAYLMKEAGYDCIGANMRLFDNEDAGISRDKTCCSLDDAEDARSVARKLSMPFYVFNMKDNFKRDVIDRFTSEYERAHTPNPCIDCNRHLKFGSLLRRAAELSCDVTVTGHYARITMENGQFTLKKSLDSSKDQSYVLYSIRRSDLSLIRFPLGELTKQEVREIAERQGFINSKKKDSQDICFVPDGDHAAAITRFTGKTYPEGNFVDMEGRVLGTHRGVTRYTVGQRRGLGLALPESLYVHHIDIEKNEVYLSRNKELFSKNLKARDVNWLVWEKNEVPEEFEVSAKIRYHAPETRATARVLSDDEIQVYFHEPVRAITPGQAVVLYDGDTVLGGGTIE